MRWMAGCGACVLAATVVLSAQSASRGRSGVPAGMRATTDFTCAADLGTGIRTKLRFCDVLIAKAPAQSVAVTIPPHIGATTIKFDLHNRFDVPAGQIPAMLSYARHEAFVTVVKPSGELVGRAIVRGEFRTADSLFDQLGGGSRPGGVKAIAPGAPESVTIPVPAALTSVGIVGTQLTITRRSSTDTWDSPGRPVALVSRVRVEYKPK